MILLVALAAVLTLVTVWYLLRPLRGSVQTNVREEYYQLSQVRERLLAQLNELDIEAGDRNMDTAVVMDERLRIEAELAKVLNDLGQANPSSTPIKNENGASRMGRIATITILAIGLPALSVGLYAVNHREVLTHLTVLETPQTEQFPPMVLEMVARLEQRLTEQPNDAPGWARLGRAYQVMNRWDESKHAYARAYQLTPDDPEVLSAYAGMLMTEDPTNPSPQAVTLFRKLLTVNPHHPGALWVLGLVAYNENQFRQAMKYWERLLKDLPAESEIAPEVRHAIAMAKTKLK